MDTESALQASASRSTHRSLTHGFVLMSPLLPLSLLTVITIMLSAACDLHPLNKGCTQELGRIERNGYSVHLILEIAEARLGHA